MPVYDLPQELLIDIKTKSTKLVPYELALKSTCTGIKETIMDKRAHDATKSDAGFYTESVAQTKYWMGYGLPPEIAFKAALRMGHIPVVKFFMSDYVWKVSINQRYDTLGPHVGVPGHHVNIAAKYGQIEVIEELLKLGCRWNIETSAIAAANNQIELMKWMQRKGWPLDDPILCSQAARYGQIKSLRFLREELNPPCPWNFQTCTYAAGNGHLECLEYADSNGCAHFWDTFFDPAVSGHLACFKYLYEKHLQGKDYNIQWACPEGIVYQCIKGAATHGQKEILLYIENRAGPELFTNLKWYECFKMVKKEWRLCKTTFVGWGHNVEDYESPMQKDLFDYIKNEKINKNMTEFKKYWLQQFVQMEFYQNANEYNTLVKSGVTWLDLVTTLNPRWCNPNPRKCPKCQTIYPGPIKLYIKREVCDLCYPDMIEEFEKEFEKYIQINGYSKFDAYPEEWDSDDEDSDGSDEDSDGSDENSDFSGDDNYSSEG